ncbi:MAG: hypothetical protein GH151_11130 [Bacteroidetes bacterium]|nr:hypothetical protein [Bacteroidota bacterium]
MYEYYEKEPDKTFMVNLYPDSFRIKANKILNRLQGKYVKLLPRTEVKPKKKRARVKRAREKQPVKC